MSGINKVILIGNLGKDPEIRRLESGVAVAKFSLATSESYKNREGNRIDQTEWHNIVLWRGLAEVAEKYLTKGKQVYIEGRIKTRSWEDKDGNKRYTTEIIGDNMTMLGGRRDQTDDPVPPVSQAEKPHPVSPEIETPEDDLPF